MRGVRHWRLAPVLLVGLLTFLALSIDGSSSAIMTARTQSSASVQAAADWTPPTVTMTKPAVPAKGTVTLSAQASDAETGIANVAIQLQGSGGAWTPICTDESAPYTCSWNTVNVADGDHSLRAIATDQAGYATTSASVTATVANSVFPVLDVPDVVRGTVVMPVTIHNPPGLYTTTVEYAPAGSNNWTTICTTYLDPSSDCSWNTTQVPSGTYDLRTRVAPWFGGGTTSSTVHQVVVDNTVPTVTMTDPGTPLRGTVTLAATATDAHSGVAQVVIQRQAPGAGTWTDVCTTTAAPYRCSLDTTTLAEGNWSFRAQATDTAGNATNSAAVTNRLVENVVSTVSLEDPGTELYGTVTLRATAASTAGVTRVVIQRAPAGGTTWTDVCTDQNDPYTCNWNTTQIGDTSYDLRAVLTDGSGKVTTSAVVSARVVDNSPLRGVDVQTTNVGTAGRLTSGDTITLTYSRRVQLSSVSPGWTGAAVPVTLRLKDGALLGLNGSNDTLDFRRNGSTLNLGTVNLAGDYISAAGGTVEFNATMTTSTATVNGIIQTRVTVTLGTVASGGTGLNTVSSAAMRWTPMAAVLDERGNACATTVVTETGTPADRDF